MFEEIPRGSAQTVQCKPEQIVMSATKFPRGGDGIIFKIGGLVMKRLGWKAEQRVKILWGRDIDLGKVRIEPVGDDVRGAWEFRPNTAKSVFRVTTGSLPDARAGKPYKNSVIDHEIIEQRGVPPQPNLAPPMVKALIVYLPKDFYTAAAKSRAA
jgi:hypothetical protein